MRGLRTRVLPRKLKQKSIQIKIQKHEYIMSQNLTIASKQWAKRPEDQRFQSLEELKVSVDNRRRISRESTSDVLDLKVVPLDGGIALEDDGRILKPTWWSFGQLANKTESPAKFIRQLKPETASTVLNERLDDMLFRKLDSSSDDMRVKLMRLEEDDGPILQAMTGPKYGRIWDSDVVKLVETLVDRSDGKFHNPKAYSRGTGEPVPSGLYGSDHDVFMFMIDGGSVFDAGPRAQLNKGFFVWNSEVGAATFGIETFLFNTVCGNHICWGATDINRYVIRHTGGGPQRFLDEGAPMLLNHTTTMPEIDTILNAQKLKLKELKVPGLGGSSEVKDWQNAFSTWKGFTRGEVREAWEIAEREEGRCETLWDIMQGMTALARDIPHIDTRIDLERRAGKLLALAK